MWFSLFLFFFYFKLFELDWNHDVSQSSFFLSPYNFEPWWIHTHRHPVLTWFGGSLWLLSAVPILMKSLQHVEKTRFELNCGKSIHSAVFVVLQLLLLSELERIPFLFYISSQMSIKKSENTHHNILKSSFTCFVQQKKIKTNSKTKCGSTEKSTYSLWILLWFVQGWLSSLLTNLMHLLIRNSEPFIYRIFTFKYISCTLEQRAVNTRRLEI